VVEAIGFQVCAALEALKLRGFAAGEMRLSGGQGRSRLWNQLKADMTGVIILTPEIIDGELAGDAALAAAALDGEDLARTVSRMVRIRDRYVPDPEAAERYRERYGAYRELYEKAKTVLGIGG
jgi:sugar (pentulose or hexulose) kinase